MSHLDVELAFASATRLAELVRRREISPVELVEGFAERIGRLDDLLGSVVALDLDGARHAAAAAQARARGDRALPFDGVPLLVKDSHATAGLRTTMGATAWADWVPDADDGLVARLRAAGFVVLGKTNLCELGTQPVTEPALFGPARNPWDPSRTPGGSSGGSAAALAAGLAPAVTASDAGGSIRIPAACCGLFGLKPTRGRITAGPRNPDGPMGLGVHGPLTHDVADAAALLDVTAGPAPGDPWPAPPPDRPFAEALAADPPRLRVGLVGAVPVGTVEAQRAAAAEAVAGRLEALGHHVTPLEMPVPDHVREDFTVLWAARVAATPIPPEQLEPFNAWLARRGEAESAGRLAAAVNRLQLVARALVTASDAVDVVISPTLAEPPPPVGALARLSPPEAFEAGVRLVGRTPLANLTGQPAASVPAGCDADGLPMGVMLTGRHGDEALLLAVAAQLQRDRDWARARPPLVEEPGAGQAPGSGR